MSRNIITRRYFELVNIRVGAIVRVDGYVGIARLGPYIAHGSKLP